MTAVIGGPTDTARPAGTEAWMIRAMLTAGRSKDARGRYRADPSKPPVLKLVGYYTRGSQPDHARLKEYEAWKEHVQRATPFPDSLPRPSAKCPVRVDVWCYFLNGTHPDPENVRKGVVDALFPEGDKWVYGYHHHPQYSAAPHVLIEISYSMEGRK